MNRCHLAILSNTSSFWLLCMCSVSSMVYTLFFVQRQYLQNTYDYDSTRHQLVINGDGAKWITSCREYFRNSTLVLDRFHIAQDIQRIFRDHPRRRSVREKFEKNGRAA